MKAPVFVIDEISHHLIRERRINYGMSVVYFAMVQGGDYLIKIGQSARLTQRMCQLSSENGHPMKLLGVISGHRKQEKTLHNIFKDYWWKGEYFEPAPDLINWIAANTRMPEAKRNRRHGGGAEMYEFQFQKLRYDILALGDAA